MLSMITRYWWALALRGLFAVLFGIVAIIWPAITLGALVLLFGAFAMADGLLSLFRAFSPRTGFRWLFVVGGIVGIAVGIVTLVWPALTALTLLYLIAGWAIVIGIVEIVEAIRLRQVIENEWLMVRGGLLSVAFGVIIAVAPGAGALAMLWVIAAYALVFGVLEIILAFRLRALGRRLDERGRRSSAA